MSDSRTQLTPAPGHGVVRRRFVPSLVTFLVAAGGIYLTAYLAIGIIQHIVMPILAILVAGWLAAQVFKHTGDSGEDGTAGSRNP